MKLSEAEIVLYLQCMRLKHGMNNVAFEEIITFIALLTDSISGPLISLYKFDQYFSMLIPGEALEKYFFCRSCFRYYAELASPETCSCGVLLIKGENQFIYQSLKTSIKSFLQTTENCEDILRYSSQTPAKNLTDITNGKRYEEIKGLHRQRHGIISKSIIEFLSVCLNIDGVQIFMSSSKSLYPVMVTFNEMSPRTRGRNVIIPLIFMSSKKIPFHQMILSILVEELREIELEGISWLYENENQRTYIYAATLCLNAPVKSKVLGIEGHSSKQGCPIASCKGVWMPKGKGGAVVWPDDKCGSPRQCKDANTIFLNIPSLETVIYKATLLKCCFFFGA